MFNRDPSVDNEYVLAAIAYFPFISLILIISSWKKQYFLKYHSAHAIIIYLISFFILILYILFYVVLRRFFTDTFLLDITWGLMFTIHLMVNFIYIFICAIRAYQGQYLIIPLVTKIFYAVFNR